MQTYMSGPLQMARRYWRMSLVRGIVLIIFGLLAMLWPHLTYALFMRLFGIFAIVEGAILLMNAISQNKQRAAGYTAQTDYRRDAGYQRGENEGRPGYQGDIDYQRNADYRRTEETRRGTDYENNPDYDREQAEYSSRSAASRRAEAQRRNAAANQGVTPEQATAVRTNKTALVLEGLLTLICGILAFILPNFVGALALYAVAGWALFKGIGALMQTGTRGWTLALVGILGVILGLVVLFNPLRIIHSFLWVIGLVALVMGVVLVVRAIQHNMKTAQQARRPEPNY